MRNRRVVSFIKFLFIVLGALSGLFVVITQFFLKRDGIELDKFTFLKYMFFGSGYTHISPAEVKEKMNGKKENFIIFDVRNKNAYDKGHIRGAISAPFNDLIVKRSVELEKEKEIIITCYGGGMSRTASSILAERGFSRVYNMDGGMVAWKYEREESNINEEQK